MKAQNSKELIPYSEKDKILTLNDVSALISFFEDIEIKHIVNQQMTTQQTQMLANLKKFTENGQNSTGNSDFTDNWKQCHENYSPLISFLARLSCDNGMNSLHLAALYEHVQIVRPLLENGTDINQLDKRGWSPLCYAALKSSSETIQMLLESGADVNLSGKENESPLFMAVGTAKNNIVKLLLEKGADPNQMNSGGLSPLGLATQCNHSEIINTINDHLSQERTTTVMVRFSKAPAESSRSSSTTPNGSCVIS